MGFMARIRPLITPTVAVMRYLQIWVGPLMPDTIVALDEGKKAATSSHREVIHSPLKPSLPDKQIKVGLHTVEEDRQFE